MLFARPCDEMTEEGLLWGVSFSQPKNEGELGQYEMQSRISTSPLSVSLRPSAKAS